MVLVRQRLSIKIEAVDTQSLKSAMRSCPFVFDDFPKQVIEISDHCSSGPKSRLH